MCLAATAVLLISATLADAPAGGEEIAKKLRTVRRARVVISDSPLELPPLDVVLAAKEWEQVLPLLIPAQPLESTPKLVFEMGVIHLETSGGEKLVLRWVETGKNAPLYSVNGKWYMRVHDDSLPPDGGIGIDSRVRELAPK